MKLMPLRPEEFLKRREIEKAFEVFSENKSGDAIDKLKMFLFEELARLALRLEQK